jgi:hypothetical protein
MDHNVYFDDWGIVNAAVEPSVEGPFVEDVARWRVWYRFSYQQGTRYLRDQPQREFKFQTADADLGTFTTHGGGALFHFEVARMGRVVFIVRISGYGLTRSDNIWGIGALIGTEVQW